MQVFSVALAASLIFACGASNLPSEQSWNGNCDNPFAKAGKLKFDSSGWKTDFCKHSVDYQEFRGGGIARDGIPPIDSPKYTSVDSANRWIRDVEPVIALEIAGQARAYPIQILIWHEIVNDELAGQAVAVTFCPLCYAAVVFLRPVIDGARLSFGTSGNLRKSDMVMWDRQTESWWQQFEGVGIVGSRTGTKLAQLPAAIVSWKSFKAAYPGGDVLSRDTGNKRAYGKNPYVGYDDISKKPFAYQGKVGSEMPPMAHVVGVDLGSVAKAYPLASLRGKGVIHDRLQGQPVAVFWQKGAASALDAEILSDGDDLGELGVFVARAGGQELHFAPLPAGGFTDRETKSQWNIVGHATRGPLKGHKLKSLAHHQVFWFAWSAFVGDRGMLFSAGSLP